jgi:hypothetical protein
MSNDRIGEKTGWEKTGLTRMESNGGMKFS